MQYSNKYVYYFGIILISCIVMLADLTGYLGFLHTLRTFIAYPFVSVRQTFLLSFSNATNSLFNGASLSEQNTKLQLRVLELEKQVSDQDLLLSEKKEYTELRSVLEQLPYKTVVEAFVLDVNANHLSGKLLLNKGSEQGVQKGMVVTLKDYYVGVIESTTNQTSVCTTLHFPNQQFLGYIQTKKMEATIKTDIGKVELYDILATEKPEVNDIVTYRSDLYGYNFPVGSISAVAANTGSASRIALIKPFIRDQQISLVTIIVK